MNEMVQYCNVFFVRVYLGVYVCVYVCVMYMCLCVAWCGVCAGEGVSGEGEG